MTPVRAVAFIGLGNMGAPMAAQLAAKGFTLRLFDQRPELVSAFVAAHGGRPASTLSDAACGAEATITMLPNDKVVREVVLGKAAWLRRWRPGAIVIDMGTSDPRATVEIGKALQARGIAYVDAPVMGGVVFAKNGTLDVMAGGKHEDIERCAPIFSAIGQAFSVAARSARAMRSRRSPIMSMRQRWSLWLKPWP